MSETQISKSNTFLTFIGCLGAFLVFVLIIFIAYLPNRPERVDAQVYATRQAKADESRAAGVQKLTNYELIDAEAGTARIPICLLYTSPSPRDLSTSRMPSSA